ncbi:MAG: hypothetical protein ACLFNV_08770 [Desulfovibrionales bacterium]
MSVETKELKKAIYDKLSPRRKKYIDRIGFEQWDPFQEPKHPIEWRRDVTGRTTQQVMDRFLEEVKPERYTSAYGRAAADLCHGLINKDERCRGVFEFCLWYRDLLEREGKLEEFLRELKAI